MTATATVSSAVDIAAGLRTAGWVLVRGSELRWPSDLRAAWRELLPCWERLPPDRYLPDGGTYRFRRHVRYAVDRHTGRARPQPPGPYYQDEATNPFAGGMLRWFDPVEPAAVGNPFLTALVAFNASVLPGAATTGWMVDVHLVRVVATAGEIGRPSPEGVHRDGFDYVSLHAVARHDVAGAESLVCDELDVPVERVVLAEPLDSLYVDDTRLRHAATPFAPATGRRAWRDTLLMSYRAA